MFSEYKSVIRPKNVSAKEFIKWWLLALSIGAGVLFIGVGVSLLSIDLLIGGIACFIIGSAIIVSSLTVLILFIIKWYKQNTRYEIVRFEKDKIVRIVSCNSVDYTEQISYDEVRKAVESKNSFLIWFSSEASTHVKKVDLSTGSNETVSACLAKALGSRYTCYL